VALIGVDLGGTQVRAGLVEGDRVVKIAARIIRSTGTEEEVLADLTAALDEVFSLEVEGLGLGIPSIVDLETGVVYDVQNIPAWREVPLKRILEARYQVPVYVNNDANCFAAGERYFGQGRHYRNLVGLIVGTGLGAGIIADGHSLFRH